MCHRLPLLVALSAALVGVGACGDSPERDDARAVVERFYDAVRQDRAEAACALLSPATRDQLESQTEQSCDAVITRLDHEGGAIVGSHVYVTNAKVDLRNDESVFLDQGPAGWRLTALACRPVEGLPRDRPYECEVEA